MKLYETAVQFPGKCKLVLHVVGNQGTINKITADDIFVSNKIDSIKAFKNKLGSENVWIS